MHYGQIEQRFWRGMWLIVDAALLTLICIYTIPLI